MKGSIYKELLKINNKRKNSDEKITRRKEIKMTKGKTVDQK